MTNLTSIIIPTCNEERNIVDLLIEIRRSLKAASIDYEVIIVDDSTDRTAEFAQAINGTKVVKGKEQGLAQAVLDGTKVSEGKYVIVMDADGQHPPGLLPEIVAGLKTHDLVVVSKHTADSSDNLSRWRRFQSYLGCLSAKPLTSINDPMTGFFGIRKECLDGVVLEAIGHKIGLEIFCRSRWTSHIEIPMNFRERRNGVSKGTEHSLHKHLIHLYRDKLKGKLSDKHRLGNELMEASAEWRAFYEGNPFRRKWKQGIAEVISSTTNSLKPFNVLDIGCGSSPNINFLSGDKFGIDVNVGKINFLRQHTSARLSKGRADKLPFLDSTFGLIICIEVIEHLKPSEADRAISEMSRVLIPEGTAILATPNYDSLVWDMVEKVQQVLQPGHWTSDHKTRFTRESLKVLCKEHELTETDYKGIIMDSDMVITYQKEVIGHA